MPSHKWVEPVDGSKMWKLPPSKDRADLRSETPMGFAMAVFEANSEAKCAQSVEVSAIGLFA